MSDQLTQTLNRLKEILIDQTADTEAAQQSAALYHEIERAMQESAEQAQAQEIEARLEQARDLSMFAAREAHREPDPAPAPAQVGEGEPPMQRTRSYKNVTIEITDEQISEEQIDMLVERAAARNSDDMISITLSDAVRYRARGDNYQFTDELARRAFEHELHLARIEGEIPGYRSGE